MPRYSEEFKREAVRLVREERMSILQAARVTGANHNTIREWIKKAELQDHQSKAFSSEKEELSALRKEVRELKMEREFLKKTLVYFAKDKSERSL